MPYALSLRPKFIIAIVLLVFLPVILMGGVSYLIFSDMIEKKTDSYAQLSLQDMDSKLKYALNEINTVTDLAITQQTIQQVLKQPPDIISSELAQELNSAIMIHPHITSFSLYAYPADGQGSQAPLYATQSGATTLSWNELSALPWFDRMEAYNGRPLWIGPGENDLDLTHGTMLMARLVKDYYSLADIGVLVVTVRPDVVEQVFWEAPVLYEGQVLLINELGRVVYSKRPELTGKHLTLDFLNNMPGSSGSYVDDIAGERSFVTYLPSFNEGWMLTASAPLEQMRAESRKIRNISLALVMFLLLTAFLFEKVFVSRLVETIVRTVNGLKEVQTGTFTEISTERTGKDESGMLVLGFNRMSRQIRELLQQVSDEQQRKKQAEMQALVAQINPHFIYNSLESINSLAVLHGNKEISKMVIALGKLLRISISENQELIPLWMEIEHVKQYMNIQKVRFEDKFEFTAELPELYKDHMTQKLVVQPLVENALYHGIEAMEEPGRIEVRVGSQNEYLFIEVRDNGPGIHPQDLERVWQQSTGSRSKYKESGVGLRNVHERLRLRFGSPYGLMICTSPGEGTAIRIRIPLRYYEGISGERGREQ